MADSYTKIEFSKFLVDLKLSKKVMDQINEKFSQLADRLVRDHKIENIWNLRGIANYSCLKCERRYVEHEGFGCDGYTFECEECDEDERETLYVCKDCGGWDKKKIKILHHKEEHRVEVEKSPKKKYVDSDEEEEIED